MIDIYSAMKSNEIHITLEMLTYENICLFLLKGSLLLINVVFYGVLFSKIFLYMFEQQIKESINTLKIKLFGTAVKSLDELLKDTIRMEVQLWKEQLETTHENQNEFAQEEDNYQNDTETQQDELSHDGVCCEEILRQEEDNEKIVTPVELNYKKEE